MTQRCRSKIERSGRADGNIRCSTVETELVADGLSAASGVGMIELLSTVVRGRIYEAGRGGGHSIRRVVSIITLQNVSDDEVVRRR